MHFSSHPDEVFFNRQLEILFERKYFHWVTVYALQELVEAREVGTGLLELEPGVPIRFFWSRRNRYWKRRASQIIELVRLYSRSGLGLGPHAELLFTEGLAIHGFVPVARNTREWGTKTWTKSSHDLEKFLQWHRRRVNSQSNSHERPAKTL